MPHKYEEVAASIRESIAQSMSPHDALASERELMAFHGVSRMTVRKAIATLVDEGRGRTSAPPTSSRRRRSSRRSRRT